MTISARPIDISAASSIACRWLPTSRPIRCPPTAMRSNNSRASRAIRPRCIRQELVGSSARACRRHYGRLFEDAPPLARQIRAAFLRRRRSDEPRDVGYARQDGVRGASRGIAIVRNWFTGEYFSLRSDSARADLEADSAGIARRACAHPATLKPPCWLVIVFFLSLPRARVFSRRCAPIPIWWS